MLAIPPELLLPTPRTIRTRKSNLRLKIARRSVFGLFLIVTVGLTACSIGEPILLERAPLQPAKIIFRHAGSGRRGANVLDVGYDFVDLGGRHQSGSAQCWSYRSDPSFAIGQTISVRYIHLGSISYVEPDFVYQDLVKDRWPFWLLTGFFDLLTAAVLIDFRRQRWMLRNGKPSLATIREKTFSKGKNGTTYFLSIAYLADSFSINDRITVNHSSYETLAEGDVICVLYDPRKPRRVINYSKSRYECVAADDRQ